MKSPISGSRRGSKAGKLSGALFLAVMTVFWVAGAVGAGRLIPFVDPRAAREILDWEWQAGPYPAGKRFTILLTSDAKEVFTAGLTESEKRALAAPLDFSRMAAIVAALGERPTTGFAVKVVSLTVAGQEVFVQLGLKDPAPDEVVGQAITYPIDLVTLPRRELPKAPFQVLFLDQTGNAFATLHVAAGADLPRTHVVRVGESLWTIAQLYGLSVGELVRRNNLRNPNLLQVGQKLVIRY